MTIKSCRFSSPELCKPSDMCVHIELMATKPSTQQAHKTESLPDGVQCAAGLNMGLISFRETYVQVKTQIVKSSYS